jgi:hypothetical protein
MGWRATSVTSSRTRPWLEEVGYHSNGHADTEAGCAHDYASRRDPRCKAPDHYDITDGRYHASGGVLVTAQQLLTVGDERFTHRLRMGALGDWRCAFDVVRVRETGRSH